MDDKKDYFLKPHKQQLFYKTFVFFSYIFGIDCDYWMDHNIPRNILMRFNNKYLLAIVIGYFVLQFAYLYAHYKELEFNTLAMIFIILPVNAVTLIKVAIAKTPSYKKVMTNFRDEISLHSLYKPNEDQVYLKKLIKQTERTIRVTYYYFHPLFVTGATTFLISPIAHNIKNNDSIHNITTRLEVVTHLWMPFDYEFNFYNYVGMQIVIVYSAYVATTTIMIFDILNLIFLFNLLGHVKYFKHLTNTLSENQIHMSDKEVKEKLVELTLYYQRILSIKLDLESVFEWNIVGIYLHNLIAGGIQMYQLMNAGNDTGTILSSGLMTPLYMGELVVFSLAFENLRTEADEIPTVIYNLPWQAMSVSNQKMVLMILFQVQPIFEFTGAIKTKTGVTPAVNIIKTTFTYYVMIKARV